MTDRSADGGAGDELDEAWETPPAKSPPRLLGPLFRAWNWLVRQLAAERERWVLWIPVGFGFGAVLYFALRSEPPAWAGLVAVGGAILGFALLRRWLPGLAVALGLLVVAAGFLTAQGHAWRVASPILAREIPSAVVTGRVMAVERRPGALRITLRDPTVSRLKPEETPAALRIRLSDRYPPPPPGALVRLRATLSPPAPPAEPGAFDFQRRAYFMGLGAAGFSVGAAEVIEAPPLTGWAAVTVAFERARGHIAERVAATISDPVEASVTAALLNGEQFAIPDATMDAFRNSGLAHLLSISGLHVGIAAGILFYVVRALLAAIPFIALRWPIKKIAALCGILSALAYTLLVGAPLPTVRSVLMTGLVMGAVLLDRDPLSMRLVAFAGIVTAAMDPEGMLGPSFQMSFAAVVALIAAFEGGGPLARWGRDAGWFGRSALYVGGIVLTSVIATLATLPFSLFHFQQIAFYGVLSNMIAIPVTSFWVMPWSLIAYALFPFGLEAPAVIAMNWGDRVVIWTAEFFGGLPWASLTVPAMPAGGFAAVILGGLWLCVWTRRWRWWGLAAVAAGLATPALVERPDVLVSGDGRIAAVRAASGRLSLSVKSEGRTAETWLQRDGVPEPDEPWPRTGAGAGGELTCDALGCLYRRGGRTVALLRLPDALDEDCGGADVVVAAFPARACRAPLVIDRWRLRRDGAHALYLEAGGIRIESVRDQRGDRPWTGRR
ncbi:ComEC/Rec2 family competence protein [Azospirillum agricola]|uniref:ComEC/Rec2 family competence protein n=1 Tax=Azospirillum agricola TaxID=1720247 RepID=UPI000A0EF037|nr:ComEC/Rec2 family competence protein [Azospirillum agricola]SMH60170.1 competence protein ComEC [Azospirillum lipoferum]